VANSECEDGNSCTLDICLANGCKNDVIPDCCQKDSQCNDQDVCTKDACLANSCSHTPIPDCCTKDEECTDGDPCTIDSCNEEAGQCVFVPTDCCTEDGECDDDEPCTADKCVEGGCLHLNGAHCDEIVAAADVWLEGGSNKEGHDFIIVGKTGSYQKKRSLVRFDTSFIPVDATVISAEVHVYYAWSSKPGGLNESGIDREVRMHRLLVPWHEKQATANVAQNGAPWSVTYVGLNDTDAESQALDSDYWVSEVYEWKRFSVTPAAQDWVAEPGTNHGVLLWATNEDTSGMDMRMRSVEFSTASERPRLFVIYD